MLPKAAYGYIQCKQRYASQDEVLSVAKGYRDRHLPADVIVVDWFYYTKMGQMDLDPKFWPDPSAMNKQLHDMGFETMISVWPRFVPDDRYYAEILKNGWFIQTADGKPIDGLPYDRAGSDIDTTNPDAAAWYWKTIHENILSKGFDSLWADETEPDLPPNGAYFHVGPGTQFFNVYPLFHTGALYDGFRKDEPNRRALILSRDAYLGVQRNGAIVWSSDIYPTWDTLRRQIPDRPRFRSFRNYVLVERYRRLAISAAANTIRRIRRCSIHRTLAPMWAAMTTTLSSIRAGSNSPRFCRSCARMAAAWRMRSGPTASRLSRFSKSTCVFAMS